MGSVFKTRKWSLQTQLCGHRVNHRLDLWPAKWTAEMVQKNWAGLVQPAARSVARISIL